MPIIISMTGMTVEHFLNNAQLIQILPARQTESLDPYATHMDPKQINCLYLYPWDLI